MWLIPRAAIAEAGGSVLPKRRTSEEAATPRIPQRAITRFWKPSGSSPSRTTGNHQPFSNSLAALSRHPRMHWGDTLRQSCSRRNGKVMQVCAEAVEECSSLWKAKEKQQTLKRRALRKMVEKTKFPPFEHREGWGSQKNQIPTLRKQRRVGRPGLVADAVHERAQFA